MLCAKLVHSHYPHPWPCGQCQNCRINAQRKIVARILMELATNGESSFFTLTYGDEHVPRLADGTQTLYKRDFQLFLKRLRKRTGPFRYFLAGEYGPKTFRPHAHGICTVSPSILIDTIDSAWSQGFTHVGTASKAAAFYSSGYVVKKMTQQHDERLKGRTPEFSLRSKRPALGAAMVERIVRKMERIPDVHLTDAPTQIRLGGRKWPLDRYIRSALRQRLNLNPRQPVLEWPSEAEMLKAQDQEKWMMEKRKLSAARSII